MVECVSGPTTDLQPLAHYSVPVSASGLPRGATLAPRDGDSAGGVWEMRWRPTLEDRSAVPRKVCFQAGYAPLPEGSHPGLAVPAHHAPHVVRCVRVRVPKCRHVAGPGDTLQSVAYIHRADWLQLYYANPSLPGANPHHVQPGQELRVGVSYHVRENEHLPQLAARFLVSEADLRHANPELSVPVALNYDPVIAGRATQLTLELLPRRRLQAGENVTVPLSHLSGATGAWPVSERCDYPDIEAVYDHCDEETHAPQERCGPGDAGVCQYDAEGGLACIEPRCEGTGEHPRVRMAAWDGARRELVVALHARVEAGEAVRLVVPRAAGLALPPRGASAVPAEALGAVRAEGGVHDPFLDRMVPMELCVVLPVCDDGLRCLYGSDCSIAPVQHGAPAQ